MQGRVQVVRNTDFDRNFWDCSDRYTSERTGATRAIDKYYSAMKNAEQKCDRASLSLRCDTEGFTKAKLKRDSVAKLFLSPICSYKSSMAYAAESCIRESARVSVSPYEYRMKRNYFSEYVEASIKFGKGRASTSGPVSNKKDSVAAKSAPATEEENAQE